jgi:hypothetical protein
MAAVRSLIAQPSKPFSQNISIADASAASRSKARGLPGFFDATASTGSFIVFSVSLIGSCPYCFIL